MRSASICGVVFHNEPVSAQFVFSSIGSFSFAFQSSDEGSYELVTSQVACQRVYPSCNADWARKKDLVPHDFVSPETKSLVIDSVWNGGY